MEYVMGCLLQWLKVFTNVCEDFFKILRFVLDE